MKLFNKKKPAEVVELKKGSSYLVCNRPFYETIIEIKVMDCSETCYKLWDTNKNFNNVWTLKNTWHDKHIIYEELDVVEKPINENDPYDEENWEDDKIETLPPDTDLLEQKKLTKLSKIIQNNIGKFTDFNK